MIRSFVPADKKDLFGASSMISSTKEFSVYIRDTEGNILWEARKDTPPGIGVVARDKPVQIVYNNGEIKYGMLNMQVW